MSITYKSTFQSYGEWWRFWIKAVVLTRSAGPFGLCLIKPLRGSPDVFPVHRGCHLFALAEMIQEMLPNGDFPYGLHLSRC